jgi:Bacterial regulatory protein, Fis family
MNDSGITSEQVFESFQRHGGNISATARELGISRSSVRRKLTPIGKLNKPIAGGSIEGTKSLKEKLPSTGKVRRYILTSAQNNTFVHDSAWDNLVALGKHYDAEIIVGTYTYNQNHYGKLSVKRGKDKLQEDRLWYDPKVEPYIQDARVELAPGLVWCGEMNILPTAVNPLAGLESYTGHKSAIFPHAKLAMRSIATMQGEGVKLNYTTGTVTQRNYIQKREGVIAEFHHIYGGLLVEVNSDGNWWVRQLNEDEKGTIQDLDVVVKNGAITVGNRVEALTLGDLHSTHADPSVLKVTHNLLDSLQPKYTFLHDIMEGAAVNHHEADNPHARFHTWLRGLHRLDAELALTSTTVDALERDFSQTVIVYSNHDDPWLKGWLAKHDARKDPPNVELFLRAQSYLYSQLRAGKMLRDINMLEWFMRDAGYKRKAKFLLPDESFLTCGKKIENGMHGHLGPAGKWGTPQNLSQMARKANTAHTHSAGIYNGLYVAGTSSKLRWNYTQGPSNWSHTHIVTYPNGKRALITIYADKWRA